MDFSHLPEPASARRIVLVVTSKEADHVKFMTDDKDAAALLDRPEVAILEAGSSGEGNSPLMQKLERLDLLRPTTLLLQDPYEQNDYILPEQYAEEVPLRKYAHFAALCQRLGAVSLTANEIIDANTQQSLRLDTGAKITKTSIGLGGEAGGSELLKLASSLFWDDEFGGQPTDIEAARQYLSEHNLDRDPYLAPLVETRAYQSNKHLRREISVNLSRESRRGWDAALKLVIPQMLDASLGLKRTQTAITNVTVKFTVTFQ